MKAIRVEQFGDPEVLQLRDVPDLQPAPGQVLVRVHAIGVNPVETYVRAGSYAVKPELPYTPGTDAAGEVAAVGADFSTVQPGDRVYIFGSISGAYAEAVLCRAEQVYPLPDNVSFARGAALGVPYGTAYYALMHRAQAKAGETVLIHGATGGVGVAAVQIARAHGLTVIGTGGSERGRDMVGREGAHHVFDHGRDDYLEAAKAITDGKGVDIVLEMLANVNLDRDLGVLAPRGRVIVIGSRGRVEIDPRQTMGKNLDIRGLTLMNATAEELKGIHAALHAGLESDTLRPVVDHELPLEQAASAHRQIMADNSYGKIVLVP